MRTFFVPIAMAAFWYLALCSIFASTPAVGFDPEMAAKADPAFDGETYEMLLTIKVDVRWDNESVKKALEDLTKKYAAKSRPHAGIRFSISLSDGDAELAKEVPERIQISIADVSVWEVLEYFSEQTHLIPLIHKGSVIMVPGKETRYRSYGVKL